MSKENLKKLLLEAGVKIPPMMSTYSDSFLLVDGTPDQQALVERVVRKLNGVGNPLVAKPSVSYSISCPDSSSVDNTNLVKRAFPLDYQEFITSMRKQFPLEEPLDGFKQLLANAGVDLSSPKTIILGTNHGCCGLLITATKKDLDTILNVMNDLHYLPPMIHIKARFIEVPQSFITDARNELHADVTNGTILTNPNFQIFLHEIKQKDVEELAEPEATTIAGWQTQMRSTVIQPIITKYVYGESSSSPPVPLESNKIFSDGSSGFVPEVQQVETGPILDVVPMVLPGNDQIDLKTTASLLGFLGYADTKNLPPNYATNSAGKKIVIPTVQPEFQVKQASLQATIYDGQTLVLFPQQNTTSESIYPDDEKSSKLIAQYIKKTEEKYPNKTLIVFLTATLIDAAGNRFHSDDYIPPQKINYSETAIP